MTLMFHLSPPQVSYGTTLKPLSGSRLLHLWFLRRRNLMDGILSWKEILRYFKIKATKQFFFKVCPRDGNIKHQKSTIVYIFMSFNKLLILMKYKFFPSWSLFAFDRVLWKTLSTPLKQITRYCRNSQQ